MCACPIQAPLILNGTAPSPVIVGCPDMLQLFTAWSNIRPIAINHSREMFAKPDTLQAYRLRLHFGRHSDFRHGGANKFPKITKITVTAARHFCERDSDLTINTVTQADNDTTSHFGLTGMICVLTFDKTITDGGFRTGVYWNNGLGTLDPTTRRFRAEAPLCDVEGFRGRNIYDDE